MFGSAILYLFPWKWSKPKHTKVPHHWIFFSGWLPLCRTYPKFFIENSKRSNYFWHTKLFFIQKKSQKVLKFIFSSRIFFLKHIIWNNTLLRKTGKNGWSIFFYQKYFWAKIFPGILLGNSCYPSIWSCDLSWPMRGFRRNYHMFGFKSHN